MYSIKSLAFLIVFLLKACVLLALPISESDSSLNDLYENLLQREYTGPISFPNHQVERKAQRSPSLRLRFGRRSDPGLSPLQVTLLQKRFNDEINKKPIRSPSLRLRFGKRGDSGSSLFDDDYYSNELNNFPRDNRAPAPRLRWGRRSDPSIELIHDTDSDNEEDDTLTGINNENALSSSSSIGDNLEIQPDKKAVRLRWGRSYDAKAAKEATEKHQV